MKNQKSNGDRRQTTNSMLQPTIGLEVGTAERTRSDSITSPPGRHNKGVELTVDPSKVTREGYLRKKGNHLYSYRFKKKYFYLEEYLLKFGTSQDKPSQLIDLRVPNTEVTVSSKYKTQFKIIYSLKARKNKLKLKADSESDRDQWVVALRKVVEQYGSSTNPGQAGEMTPGG
jgi:PH domain